MPLTDEDVKIMLEELFTKSLIEKVNVEIGENRVASNSRSVAVILKDGGERNLFLKVCEDGFTSGNLNKVLKISDREIFFYNELFPKFLSFVKENAVKSQEIDLESLFLHFYGSKSLEGKGSLIILEKFFSTNYFVTKPEEFFTLKQIHYCMKGIATFHATSYTIKQKENIDWLNYDPLLPDVLFHPSNAESSKTYFGNIFESNLKILGAIKEEIKKQNELVKDCILSFNSLSNGVLDRLKNIVPNLPQILYKTLDCPTDLCIVTHGDFHMWNVAFSNTGKMHTKFFDLQMLRATSGLIDVHHFLSQVCTPATRNMHLHKFLETYHSSFKESCLSLGLDESEIVYTKEVINKEYIVRSPWGFIFGFCFILPRFLSKKQLSFDFYSKLKEINESSDIIKLISENASLNVWSVLDMYVDMVQIEDDLGTLELMEKLAK